MCIRKIALLQASSLTMGKVAWNAIRLKGCSLCWSNIFIHIDILGMQNKVKRQPLYYY